MMDVPPESIAIQAGAALAYYAVLILLMRLAGKRLAGQTTTFDLIVLIGLAVAVQNAVLRPGPANSLVFVIVVFIAHRVTSMACARWAPLRHLLRGRPRELVRNGRIIVPALELEGISEAELMAGLRKLGHDSVDTVRLAVLEETGHISAVARDAAGDPP